MTQRNPLVFLQAATIACLTSTACASGDGVAPASGGRIASIDLALSTPSLLVGDTLRPLAVARDDAGRAVTGITLAWSTTDSTVLRVRTDGHTEAVRPGTARMRVVAAGGAWAEAGVVVTLTNADRRFAYTFAHDADAAEAYTPMRAFSHNATGGEIRVVRRAAGKYTVTLGRLAKVNATVKEVLVVTAYGSAGERCHIDDWGNASNARDLEAYVSCYDAANRAMNARFTLLVVGAQSLPGRHGFATTAFSETDAASGPTNSFSSSGALVAVDRSAAGSYLVRLRSAGRNFPENYFVSTVGGAQDLCKVSSWNFGDWASVVCYAPTGAHTDSRFALLMLEGGRPGKRFGFAWANDASAPIDLSYTPAAAYQRSSSGQPVSVTHTAQGEYVVEFPGLANGGATAEIVQVSPFGAGLTSCQLEGWTEDAAGTLRAHVRCWNRASGSREDGQFTILVLE